MLNFVSPHIERFEIYHTQGIRLKLAGHSCDKHNKFLLVV